MANVDILVARTYLYAFGCLVETFSKGLAYDLKEPSPILDHLSKIFQTFSSSIVWEEIYDDLSNRIVRYFPSLKNIKHLPAFLLNPTDRKAYILTGTFFIFYGIHGILAITKSIVGNRHYKSLGEKYIKIDNIDDCVTLIHKIVNTTSLIFQARALQIPCLFLYSNFVVAISIFPIAVKAFFLLKQQYDNSQK